MMHTPECTRTANFTEMDSDLANADLRGKHSFSNSHLNVSDAMKRRERFTFNRNENQLWQ
jgi:hypothetical protein